MYSCLSLLLPLSLCCAVAVAGTFTLSPEPQHEPLVAVRSSPHLTFSLDAHHHSPSPANSFHPLSRPSAHSSRFTTLQYNLATANMTGCPSIDFSALVTISEQGPYRLIVDTGSTTLAVVSSECTTCDSVQPTYTPAAGTETNNDQPVTSKYGGGTSWSGHAYTASVAVGDSSSVSMAIATIETNDKFIDGANICAVNQGARLGLNTSQGIIGFAYPMLAIGGTDSWITNYVTATGVSDEFTIQLCPTGGNLWIGSYDAAFVGGPFTYIPIVKTTYYAVMLHDISVVTSSSSGTTSTSLGYTEAEYGPCVSTTVQDCSIVDSGTTLMQLPAAIYQALVNFIEADSYYKSVFGSNGPASVDPLSSSQCAGASSSMPSLAEMQQKLPRLSLTFTDANSASVTVSIDAIPGYLSVNYDESGDVFYCAGIGSTPYYTILGFAFINQFHCTARPGQSAARVGGDGAVWRGCTAAAQLSVDCGRLGHLQCGVVWRWRAVAQCGLHGHIQHQASGHQLRHQLHSPAAGRQSDVQHCRLRLRHCRSLQLCHSQHHAGRAGSDHHRLVRLHRHCRLRHTVSSHPATRLPRSPPTSLVTPAPAAAPVRTAGTFPPLSLPARTTLARTRC